MLNITNYMSRVEARIHELRLKIQSLNHRRQDVADFTEARAYQTTANNIFNEMLKLLEMVSTKSKKPIEQLTIELV